MLFSAVSPALAAAFLSASPAALGSMLGLPERATAAHVHDAALPDECSAHHHGHGVASGHPADHALGSPVDERSGENPGGGHNAHGIYCVLCLAPSSVAALTAATLALEPQKTAQAAPAHAPERSVAFTFHPPFRSRAPPL